MFEYFVSTLDHGNSIFYTSFNINLKHQTKNYIYKTIQKINYFEVSIEFFFNEIEI